jgi:methylisocitrate lyase
MACVEAGADMVFPEAMTALDMYPRFKNAAALKTYQTIREKGTQKPVVDIMQTRADLYRYLNYHDYEARLDRWVAQEKSRGKS